MATAPTASPKPADIKQDIADQALADLLGTLRYSATTLVKHLTPDQLDELMAEANSLSLALLRERIQRAERPH